MDHLKMGNDSSSYCNTSKEKDWTNERHMNFLSSIEATFVQTVLKSKKRFNPRFVHRKINLPLDRFVPDISESTLDLQTAKNHTSSVAVHESDPVPRARSRQRERPQTHPYKISGDQVVSQLEDRAGDKDVKRPHLLN